VLGMGTLWELMGLLQGAGTVNPVFTGENAMREFAALIGSDTPTPVPVENKGEAGTRDGHWRETVFGNELMTGILDTSANPVSRMTVAAMEDMGYQVNLDAAEGFSLPSALELAIMGIGAVVHPQGCMMAAPRRRTAGGAQLRRAERVQRGREAAEPEKPEVLWLTGELGLWRRPGRG
jgi:hypothetical protein